MKRRSQVNIELDDSQDGSLQSKKRKELPRDPWNIPSDLCHKVKSQNKSCDLDYTYLDGNMSPAL